MTSRRFVKTGIIVMLALVLAGGVLFVAGCKKGAGAKTYTMVSIPKLRATWFDPLVA